MCSRAPKNNSLWLEPDVLAHTQTAKCSKSHLPLVPPTHTFYSQVYHLPSDSSRHKYLKIEKSKQKYYYFYSFHTLSTLYEIEIIEFWGLKLFRMNTLNVIKYLGNIFPRQMAFDYVTLGGRGRGKSGRGNRKFIYRFFISKIFRILFLRVVFGVLEIWFSWFSVDSIRR